MAMNAVPVPTFPIDLSGRVAIVTGASRRRGIGAAICRALAGQGADILFTHWRAFDRTQPHGADEHGPAALEEELRTLGVRAVGMEVDLAPPDAAARVLDATVAHLGAPTILVNNAAYSVPVVYEEVTAASLDAHYAVNVRAMVLLSVEFARRYPGGVGGRIINLSSGQGIGAMPWTIAYATSKGAVEAFTVSLAAGVAGKGITVNAIDPGATDSGWMTEQVRSDLLWGMGLGRLGQPEDAARLVVFLASEAGGWISGQIIHSRGS